VLTPFDIEDLIAGVQPPRRGDRFSEVRFRREKADLLHRVLVEIAYGSPDAKSLAVAALKIERKEIE